MNGKSAVLTGRNNKALQLHLKLNHRMEYLKSNQPIDVFSVVQNTVWNFKETCIENTKLRFSEYIIFWNLINYFNLCPLLFRLCMGMILRNNVASKRRMWNKTYESVQSVDWVCCVVCITMMYSIDTSEGTEVSAIPPSSETAFSLSSLSAREVSGLIVVV
jgi:hypothetical protein